MVKLNSKLSDGNKDEFIEKISAQLDSELVTRAQAKAAFTAVDPNINQEILVVYIQVKY